MVRLRGCADSSEPLLVSFLGLQLTIKIDIIHAIVEIV